LRTLEVQLEDNDEEFQNQHEKSVPSLLSFCKK
jgi:hypothetical protein